MLPSTTTEQVFSIAMDLSAIFHVPVKLFAMHIIYRHSPSNMEALPYFLLNIMAWNFLANICSGILHVQPQFPAECFKVSGPIALLTTDERAGHIVFGLLFACIHNTVAALFLAFPYRFFVFTYPDLISKFTPKWGWACCASVHIGSSAISLFSFSQLIVSYDDYPERNELPARDGIYCFVNNGWKPTIFIVALILGAGAALTIILLFSLLLRRQIMKMKNLMSEQTLKLQSKFLRYLLIITIVPVAVGACPIGICVLCLLFPHISYSREVAMTCVVLVMNFGAVNAIISIATFKPYWNAAKRITRKALRAQSTSVQPLHKQ
ncbi:hypothetical protein QR680_015631 [Steinernema hermaphroditum]|uniref:Uncharacterized protein n=1 Tax=Steinernema hermaphroditum TaxID=289476 RepID=A0AA39H8G8_9BILA|nr:hypothetical protein QR680_015631 [Steinernema hermaphroditum]